MNTIQSRPAHVLPLSAISDHLREQVYAFSAITSLLAAAPNDAVETEHLYFLLQSVNQGFQAVLTDLERVR